MAGSRLLPTITAPIGQVPTSTALPVATPELLAPGREQVRAIGAATDEIFGFAKQQRAQQDTIDLARAHIDAGRELDEVRTGLESDGDFRTKAERFRQASDAIRQKYSGTFGGETQARFLANYDQIASGMEMDVRHAARRDEVQQGRATLDDANTQLVGKAVFAKNDVERDGYLKQVKDNLDGAISSGIITAGQRKTAEHQYLGKFDEATATRMIAQQPGGALAALNDPKLFPYMDPVKRAQLQTTATTRLETLGATARLEARADAADMVQGFHAGLPPDDYEKRLAAVKAIDPKAAAKVEASSRTYSTIVTFNARPLTEQAEILKGQNDKLTTGAGFSAEERQVYAGQLQSYQKALTRWSQDPFTEAVNTNKVVKQLFDNAAATAPAENPRPAAAAVDAALDWQTQNGVPPSHLAVVSAGQAKQLAQELAGLNGAEFNARLGQLKQQYGGRQFEILQRQLAAEQKGAGKITSLPTALELPDTVKGQTARANLIDAGKVSDDDLKKVYTDDNELKTTRQGVEDGLADLRASLGGTPGGMSTMARYVDDGTRLAATFRMQGLTKDQSVARAVQQLVGDHYTFMDGGAGGKVRVPTTIDGATVDTRTVRANLDAARGDLDPGALSVPQDPTPGADGARNAKAFAERVKAYGRWVTEAGGRSAILAYEANGRLQPVLTREGKPVSVDFLAPRMKPAMQPPGLGLGVVP